MSIEGIRNTYGVPAKRGGRVLYSGGIESVFGTITSARGHYLRVRIDGQMESRIFHPTWDILYLSPTDCCKEKCEQS